MTRRLNSVPKLSHKLLVSGTEGIQEVLLGSDFFSWQHEAAANGPWRSWSSRPAL